MQFVLTILLLVGLLLLSLFVVVLNLVMKMRKREESSLTFKFLEVRMPKGNEIEIAVAEQFFTNLHSLPASSGGISFEIVGQHESIRFILAVPEDVVSFVQEQIHSIYSEAEVIEVEEYNIFPKEGVVAFGEFSLSSPSYLPLRTYQNLAVDPLNQLTTGLSKLEPGEGAVVQVIMRPATDKWRKAGQGFVNSANQPDKEGNIKNKVDTSVLQAVGEKCSKVGFETVIRIVVVGNDTFSSQKCLSEISSSFGQFSQPHLGKIKKSKIWSKKVFLSSFMYRYSSLFSKPTVLNVEELATIIHFPNDKVLTPHINWLLSRTSEAPANIPTEGLYLGKSDFRGRKKDVLLACNDRRRHMYVIGQTGTGKSEFLKFLAQQDIRNGEGLCFIDPHGDAVEDLLQMVPEERTEDVIYFNPADVERPMGFNILDVVGEENKHKTVNAFIALLYKLYDPNRSGVMGPMLERAIRNVMLTAMSERGSTLVEVLRLLIDPDFAKAKVPLIQDPLVKQFWTKEMAQTSDFHKSEKLGYFISKFDRFVTEKLMRNIVGQSYSAFNFRKVMDEKKILLVNLAKGLVGEENSSFLGLMIVPQILMAAMSRTDILEKDRQDFYLYVDEFQNFATDDFAEILSEARKYRLNLIVANQFISQIDARVKDAVFGNVGTMVSFRIGVDDAGYLESQFQPNFDKSDLMNLTIGKTYMKLLIDGQPSRPFSMTTDWSAACAVKRDLSMAEKLKEFSRMKYGQDRSEVEADIMQRSGLLIN